MTGSFSNDCLLTHLRRFTEYSIIVQAFNRKGAGPPSKETICRSLQNDPPSPPSLRISSSSISTVHLAWNPADEFESDDTSVDCYTIYYKHNGVEWERLNVSGVTNSYVFRSLACGTTYQFYIIAMNEIGWGEASDAVSITTQGVAPIAPAKHTLLSVNSTSANLNLKAWDSGGCPVTYFTVQLKPRGETQWNVIPSPVSPYYETFIVPGLVPGSWYNLLVSAHNPAGSTEAEYVFSTLTSGGGTVSPILSSTEKAPSFYRTFSFIVPLFCAAVVLLVIFLVALVVCVKRNRPLDDSTSNTERERHETIDTKVDNISLTSVGMKQYDSQRDALYYPSQYATTRMSMYSADSESLSGHSSSLHRAKERNQHIYEVPFPPKQVPYQSCNSRAVHDYQPLYPVCREHEKTYGDFLFLNEETLEPDAAFSEFKPEWTRLNQPANHRIKVYKDLSRNDIYPDRRSFNKSTKFSESSPENFQLVDQAGNSAETQELSEAECDRDYVLCNLKQQAEHSTPFFSKRLRNPTEEYDF